MVGSAAGGQLEAGDLPLPVLRGAPSRVDGARARAPGRRHTAPSPRAHRVRAGRETGRPHALVRAVARRAAAADRPLLAAVREEPRALTRRRADSNPSPTRTRTAQGLATSVTRPYLHSS